MVEFEAKAGGRFQHTVAQRHSKPTLSDYSH